MIEVKPARSLRHISMVLGNLRLGVNNDSSLGVICQPHSRIRTISKGIQHPTASEVL